MTPQALPPTSTADRRDDIDSLVRGMLIVTRMRKCVEQLGENLLALYAPIPADAAATPAPAPAPRREAAGR